MDEKMHFMTDAGELLDWMREHEEFKIINKVEAQMLICVSNSSIPIHGLSLTE